MKVLFVCYPHVGLGKGGLFLQIVHTKKSLEKLGIQVVMHEFMENKIPEVDICHVFSTNPSSHPIINYCKSINIPVVISSVYGTFNKSKLRVSIENKLSKLLPGFLPQKKTLLQAFKEASRVITLNEDESNVLSYVYGTLLSNKLEIIPNGVDHSMFGGDEYKFRSKFNIENKKIVLNVGVVCEGKNQLNLIRASEEQNWTLLIIGKLDNSEYSLKCKQLAEANDNILLLGQLPYGSEDLKGAYKSATVFCLPSVSEVQPLTLIEAAQYNCNLLVSENVPVQSFFKECIEYCKVYDVNHIRSTIIKSLKTDSQTQPIISKELSWDDVGKKIQKIYFDILKKNNS
jgi:glycosyltransferase involved in cell wall biosynthesis